LESLERWRMAFPGERLAKAAGQQGLSRAVQPSVLCNRDFRIFRKLLESGWS
jgi:hypothetical protein